MTRRNGPTGAYVDVIVGKRDETRFLRSTLRMPQRPGDIVSVGRRLLGPVPIVGAIARKGIQQARKLKHRSQTAARLIKALCRDPEAAQDSGTGVAASGSQRHAQVDPDTRAHYELRSPHSSGVVRRNATLTPVVNAAAQPPMAVARPEIHGHHAHLQRRGKMAPQAVESVIAQTYPYWELICINDHSSAPHIRPSLDELAILDSRVRVIHRETNGGVSVATNQGLAHATGDYIAFMDHDDYLEPHALDRFAEAVLQDQPDMIYSDEAITEVDINSIRHVTSRPSFSYDYYLSHPFFVHLVAARTEIVRRIGGLNEEMMISQDIDYGLRLFESCSQYHARARGSLPLANPPGKSRPSAEKQSLRDDSRRTRAAFRADWPRCRLRRHVEFQLP